MAKPKRKLSPKRENGSEASAVSKTPLVLSVISLIFSLIIPAIMLLIYIKTDAPHAMNDEISVRLVKVSEELERVGKMTVPYVNKVQKRTEDSREEESIAQLVNALEEAKETYKKAERAWMTKDYGEADKLLTKSYLTIWNRPATLVIEDLIINPLEALPNQKIDINVKIANIGGCDGTETIKLKINDLVEQERLVAIGSEAAGNIIFSVNKESYGDYRVNVGRIYRQFKVVTVIPTPLPPVTQNVAPFVNAQGVFTQNVSVGLTPPAGTQPIGSATLNINSGTTGLTSDGQPLSQITVQQVTSAPAPPSGDTIIGLPYDFKPDGATFSPPAELVFTGVPLDSVVMYWNGSAWIELETRVVGNTLVAEVPHFTTFAVFAMAKPTTGPPAALKVGSLKISLAAANVAQSVNITVTVSNTGGTSGEYTVVLKLNNKVEQEKKVTVSGGATKEAVFTVTGVSAGNYSVDVNGLIGAFTVKAEAEPTPTPGRPWLTYILIGMGVVAGGAAYLLWRRRQLTE